MSAASGRWLRSRSSSVLTTRRRLLLFIAVAMLVLISPALVGNIFDGVRFQDRLWTVCHQHSEDVMNQLLPPAPSTDQQLARNLFMFLTQDLNEYRICRRMLRLGGEAVKLGRSSAVVTGDHVGCVDRDLLLSRRDCLVYSFAPCHDQSFRLAAENFGCDAFSFMSCSQQPSLEAPRQSQDQQPSLEALRQPRDQQLSIEAPRQPQDQESNLEALQQTQDHEPNLEALLQQRDMDRLVNRMEKRQRHISFLGLSTLSFQFMDMLDDMPKSLLDNVQQIGIVFNLTTGVDPRNGKDRRSFWLETGFGRRLYRGIQHLQEAGFVMFDVESIKTLDSVSIRVPGSGVIDTILRTSWLKTNCH